nr:MAG TPA: hypothetical protein [Caudoviricetes sp.]
MKNWMIHKESQFFRRPREFLLRRQQEAAKRPS